MAPEHKFPIWLDDACEVTQYILANKTVYGTKNNVFSYSSLIVFTGGDEKTKVGVAGDSAGGLIAACVCRTIKDLDFQVRLLF